MNFASNQYRASDLMKERAWLETVPHLFESLNQWQWFCRKHGDYLEARGALIRRPGRNPNLVVRSRIDEAVGDALAGSRLPE